MSSILAECRLVLLFLLLLIGPCAGFNETELSCKMRLLSYRFAQKRQERPNHVWKDIFDALGLQEICGISHSSLESQAKKSASNIQDRVDACSSEHCIFVAPPAGNRKYKSCRDGSMHRPFSSLEEAVTRSRELDEAYNTTIVLRDGTHSLKDTIRFGKKDSGLSLTGYPGEEVWISGAIEIPETTDWDWDCKLSLQVRVANLTDLLRGRAKIPQVASLFAPNKRLIRARYPNSDPELDQWGYRSPGKYKYSIHAEEVLEWHRPPRGKIPDFTFVDLRHPPTGVPVKNDSAQQDFNSYASGSGGVCADLWGPQADSYWCSNASSGGWAEVDRECAVTGQLQIPVGMTYNRTSELGQRLEWYYNLDPQMMVGGVIHAWHSQTWSMHMFAVAEHTPGEFWFEPGGGRQGARNWCRCDQCGYAAPWCGQYQDPPVYDTRLVGGTWIVENVLAELDQPGEFFFDPQSKLLYLYPNRTQTDPSGRNNLRLAFLETLVHVGDGARDVTFTNIGFRESALTYARGDYSPPSGGDWSVHRGGALFIEKASNIAIIDCVFQRLDGNGVFIADRTRNVRIQRSVFEWLGESAIVLWGETRGYDGTTKDFPIDTAIQGNIMRELGIFQKQSSAVAHNKAARTMIRDNIMYNMARAAVNFNDMMGGGDVVARNVIFNTCRESGDHGPINSWDRQPFMTDIWQEDQASFIPKRRRIFRNIVIANYGASEGVDNDDGSSWYHVSNNVFFDAEGFKMDYGGHDSLFEYNLVISYPTRIRRHGGSRCINFQHFLPGHGHIAQHNKCVVPNPQSHPLIELAVCQNGHQILQDNLYYTPSAAASIKCGYNEDDPLIPFRQARGSFGLEMGSSVLALPNTADEIVSWAWETLHSSSHTKEAIE